MRSLGLGIKGQLLDARLAFLAHTRTGHEPLARAAHAGDPVCARDADRASRTDVQLTLEREVTLAGGAVELVYRFAT